MKPGAAMLSAIVASISPVALAADIDTASIYARFGARPDLLLCAVYAINPSDTLHAELDARKLLSSTDWEAISKKAAQEGLSECSGLAIYGMPSAISYEAEYKATGIDGVLRTYKGPFTIYRYQHVPDSKTPRDVYIKAGIVHGLFDEFDVY